MFGYVSHGNVCLFIRESTMLHTMLMVVALVVIAVVYARYV